MSLGRLLKHFPPPPRPGPGLWCGSWGPCLLSGACKEATLFCHMGPDLKAAPCFSKPVCHRFVSRCPCAGTSVSSHPCGPLNTSRCPPTSLSCGPSTLARCHEWALLFTNMRWLTFLDTAALFMQTNIALVHLSSQPQPQINYGKPKVYLEGSSVYRWLSG